MDRIKDWYANTNKTNLIIVVLVLLILYLWWRVSFKSHKAVACKDCHLTDDGQPAINTPKAGQFTLICYYATWCGYSRSFLPVWKEFEDYVKDNLPGIKPVKIKCEGDKESLCSSKGVKGYPTVILYSSTGESVQFNGDRTVDELIEFCKRYTK